MGFFESFGGTILGLGLGLIGNMIMPGMGFMIGFAIGSMVGSLLFGPDSPTVEAGRLDDLEVQVSTYGQPIPDLYGTMRMAGNVIWIEGNALRERVVSKKKNGVKYKTYKYSVSLAILICRGEDAGALGPIEGINKIWANSKLVYDIDNDIKRPYVSMRIYRGTLTQEADSLMAADVGVENCPAFRGRAYVVLKDFALEDFGNRIPTFEFEVSRGNAMAYPESVQLTSVDVRRVGHGGWFIDRELDRLWVLDGNGSISIYDLSLAELIKTIVLQGQDEDASYFALQPNYWLRQAMLSSKKYSADAVVLTTLDMDSMEQISVFRGDCSSYSMRFYFEGHTYSHVLDQIYTVIHPTGQTKIYAGLANMDSENFKIEVATGPRNAMFWLERWEDLAGNIYRYPVYTPIDTAMGVRPWAMDTPRLVVCGQGALYVVEPGTEWRILYGYVATEHGGSSVSFPTAFWDYRRNRLIIFWSGSNAALYDVLNLDNLTLTRVVTAHGICGGDYDYNRDRYMFWTDEYPGADDIHLYEPDGTYIDARPNVMYSNLDMGSFYCPPTAASVIGLTDAGAWQIFLDQVASGDGPALTDVVSEIALKTDLTAGDIDVSALEGQVRGYAVTRNATARAQLEPLRKAYRFDGVESDDNMVFTHRSGEAVLEIAEEDLMGDNVIVLSRKQEAELPREITLTYSDPEIDYQQAAQRARKSTGATSLVSDIELPLVLDADEAAQVAETLLHQDHLSRTGKKVEVPRPYLPLDPGDVVQIPRGSAYYHMLLTSANFGEGKLALEGVKDHPRVYSSRAVGHLPANYTPAVVYNPYPVKAFVVDCPMLSDADDNAGWYWGAGLIKGTWKGVDLLVSEDGQEWGAIATTAARLTYGAVRGVLGAAPATVWDWSSSPVVQMAPGCVLSSASELDVLCGTNMALVGSPAGGWEVIGFQSAQDNGDGSYTLGGLLRGRRGTEWMCGAHVGGEAFVLLDGALARIWDSTAHISVTQYLKTVPFGLASDLVRPQSFANGAAGLKPYAPAVYLAVRGEDDTTVSLYWHRRTRVDGEWHDGHDVPMVEEAEAYEIDVLDADGAVRATHESDVESFVYSSAQSAADFSVGDPIAHAITNPDAETGDTTGWTVELGSIGVRTASPSPYAGSYYFKGGSTSEFKARHATDIDLVADGVTAALIDAGSCAFKLEWWQASYAGSDRGEMMVRFLDAASALMSEVGAGLEATLPAQVWELRSMAPRIPVGCRYVQVVMHGKRYAGTALDAYFDDISAATIATDLPDPITFNIYQLSVTVGRGFARAVTV